MTSKSLRIELGINRLVRTITRTNPNMRLFSLENYLIDVTDETAPRPVWYTDLQYGDTLSYRLVDITDLEQPTAPEHHPTVTAMGFRDVDTGRSVNPFGEAVLEWKLSDGVQWRPSPPFGGTSLPTWDVLWRNQNGSWESGPLTLAPSPSGGRAFTRLDMSVALEIQQGQTRHDSWVDHFVFDPEMIVSETG